MLNANQTHEFKDSILKVEIKTNTNHVKAVNIISENSQMNYKQTLVDQLVKRSGIQTSDELRRRELGTNYAIRSHPNEIKDNIGAIRNFHISQKKYLIIGTIQRSMGIP